MVPPEAMGTSGLRLLLGLMSGSMILWQLGFLWLSQAHVTTKDHTDVLGLHCCLMVCVKVALPHARHHTWKSGSSSAIGWHGKGRAALTSYHLLSIVDGRTIPKVMRLEELVPPLTSCSTWETGQSIQLRQHSSTGPACRSAGEPPSEQYSTTGSGVDGGEPAQGHESMRAAALSELALAVLESLP